MLRRFLIVISYVMYLAFFSLGCSAVRDSYSALEACRADSACYAEMRRGSDLASAMSTAGVASVPGIAPYANVIGSSVGMFVSLLIGVYLGKKKVR